MDSSPDQPPPPPPPAAQRQPPVRRRAVPAHRHRFQINYSEFNSDSDEDYNVAGGSSTVPLFQQPPVVVADPVAPSRSNDGLTDENPQMQVKVKWNGKIERIPMRKVCLYFFLIVRQIIIKPPQYQKLQDLVQSLAARCDKKDVHIMLMMNDQLLDPSDTPASIGYTIGKFISKAVCRISGGSKTYVFFFQQMLELLTMQT